MGQVEDDHKYSGRISEIRPLYFKVVLRIAVVHLLL